jgi:uncharacterized repeat protein (TIGR01451 family)
MNIKNKFIVNLSTLCLLASPITALTPSPVFAAAERCYLLGDDDRTLVKFDRVTGQVSQTINLSGSGSGESGESIYFQLPNGPIYSVLQSSNPEQLITIDINSGAASVVGTNILGGAGNLNGANGSINPDTLTGITRDPVTGNIYAITRDNLTEGILIQIDPNTGAVIRNAFGSNKDYVSISGLGSKAEDIAIDPADNQVYITGGTKLGTLDITTGAVSNIKSYSGITSLNNMEGLTFAPDGKMYGTTELSTSNFKAVKLVLINKNTGALTLISDLNTNGDYEGIGCLTAETATLSIDKTVSLAIDADSSGGYSAGDTVEYTITANNTSGVDAEFVIIEDNIPTNTTFVVNSLKVNNTADDDALNTGVAGYDSGNNKVVFRLGTGATTTAGGTIANNATHTAKFQIKIDNPLPNGVTQISNQSTGTSPNVINLTSNKIDTPTVSEDYGDAPDTGSGTGNVNYKTTKADGGPSHTIIAGLKLGSNIDADSGSLQNSNADADDNSVTPNDEDGVSSFSTLTTELNQTYTVPVNVTNSTGSNAFVVGYIDFNKDGDFDDANEKSATVTVASDNTTNPRSVNVTFTTPSGISTGTTYARFRLGQTQAQVESAIGSASSGEVEDYKLTITDTSSGGGGTPVCQSIYNEVYIGASGNSIYSVHGPTGGTRLLTNTASASTVNSVATDHNNKLVYYAEGTSVYAWDAINNTHITITSDIRTFINPANPSSLSSTILSAGGGAFYNGSLYLGVDPPQAGFLEIYKVNLSADGKTITSVSALGVNQAGKADGALNNGDWGDFIISNDGIIYASSGGTAKYWSYNLSTSTYTDLTDNISQSSQLAKDGTGRLWSFRNGTNTVGELSITGNSAEIVGTPQSTGSISAADAGECVVGSATVGDFVWNDINGDGVQDGGSETGISGVTVGIYRDLNKDGVLDANEPLLATKVTDNNGAYSFTELLPHDTAKGAGHNDFIVKVISGAPSGTIATNGDTKAVDLVSASEIYLTADFGYRTQSLLPNILLVKRITAIKSNGITTSFNNIVFDPNTTVDPGSYNDDGDAKWPTNYLQGGGVADLSPSPVDPVDNFNLRPGDEIEYTIYFLNNGAGNAKNVRVCDRVLPLQALILNSYNNQSSNDGGLGGADKGVVLALGRNGGANHDFYYLTNIADSPDRGQFFPTPDVPVNCNFVKNDDGAIVVDINRTADPAFVSIPPGGNAGSVDFSYGYIRFWTKVE